jgi:hypothetical protein
MSKLVQQDDTKPFRGPCQGVGRDQNQGGSETHCHRYARYRQACVIAEPDSTPNLKRTGQLLFRGDHGLAGYCPAPSGNAKGAAQSYTESAKNKRRTGKPRGYEQKR